MKKRGINFISTLAVTQYLADLPHFADVEEYDMEAYKKAPIIFPTAVPVPDPVE